MRVRFTRKAVEQLDEIFAFIAKDNPAAAGRVVRRIEDISEALGRNPHLGREVPGKRYRVFPAYPYPYLIFYEVADSVNIVRVRHAARRPQHLNDPAVPFIPALAR